MSKKAAAKPAAKAAKPATKAAAKPAAKPAAAKSAAKPAAKSAASKSASKSPASASKSPASASKSAAKPAAAAASKQVPGVKVINKSVISNDPSSAHVILFTMCGNAVNIMLVKENYGKWGIPGGAQKDPKEDLKDTAAREFAEETGHALPKFEFEESFRHKNSMIFMGFTRECIEPAFGSNVARKNRGADSEILELKHVSCASVMDWIKSPGAGFLLRQVFVDMFNEHSDKINKFCAKCS